MELHLLSSLADEAFSHDDLFTVNVAVALADGHISSARHSHACITEVKGSALASVYRAHEPKSKQNTTQMTFRLM